MGMGSAASAASGTPAIGGNPTGYRDYQPMLSLENWRKLSKDNFLKGSRDEWDMWQGDMNARSTMRRPLPTKSKESVDAIPGPEEDPGSTPGFEKVQRFLRQQRAAGRVVSPEQERTAWTSYWDVWSGKQTEREKIGIERERLDFQKWLAAEQLGMSKEELEYRREQEEGAAKSKGMGMIGMGVGFAVGGPPGAVIGGILGGWIGGSF